jgi:LacI family transcriptional regulator
VKRVTIKDIANVTGFSINTVSRALNSKPEIRTETKEKILETATRLGYRPNRLAQGLRLNKTATIGVIVTDVANPFFSALVKGVAKAARDLGYSIILQDTDEDYAGEEEAIQVMLSEQVDGLLITPVQNRKETIEKLAAARFPFVLLGRYFDDLETAYVVPNDYQGGFLATEHLLEQGHTRIAMVNGPLHISSARERFQGFSDALAQFTLPIERSLVVTGALTVEDGLDLSRPILKQAPRPSAIVCYSDFVAFGVMQAIREIGLSIPDDIAVIGFDDVRMASCLQVPLTTIRSPKEELGRQAMQVLARRLRGDQDAPVVQQQKLDVELVVRGSTQKRMNVNQTCNKRR